MIEGARIIALGSAYVEGKIKSRELHLPTDRNLLPVFLDNHPEADLYAGGSVPNILTSFARISGNPNIRLLSCVGNDTRGRFYTEHMEKGFGKPKVNQNTPTDLWIGIYSNGLIEGMDFFGAMAGLTISERELREFRNGVFITDVDACKTPELADPISRTIETLGKNDLFALSLVGSHPNQDISEILNFTDRMPDLVFGNAYELSCISSEKDFEEAVKTSFPDSKIVVFTQGGNGSYLRWNGQVFHIPALLVPENKVVDETGAGDSYMGTVLALVLYSYNWTEHIVVNAAKSATYASSLVIQSMHSRLTGDMAKQVLDYAKLL